MQTRINVALIINSTKLITFHCSRNTIASFCKSLNVNPIDKALSAFARSLFRGGKTNCLPLDRQKFADFLQSTQLTDFAVKSGARQAIYQECCGFGWFSSTSAQNQPFGESVPVELFYESCLLAFGNEYVTKLCLISWTRLI